MVQISIHVGCSDHFLIGRKTKNSKKGKCVIRRWRLEDDEVKLLQYQISLRAVGIRYVCTCKTMKLDNFTTNVDNEHVNYFHRRNVTKHQFFHCERKGKISLIIHCIYM